MFIYYLTGFISDMVYCYTKTLYIVSAIFSICYDIENMSNKSSLFLGLNHLEILYSNLKSKMCDTGRNSSLTPEGTTQRERESEV